MSCKYGKNPLTNRCRTIDDVVVHRRSRDCKYGRDPETGLCRRRPVSKSRKQVRTPNRRQKLPTNKAITIAISRILESANLNTITKKQVKTKLEKQFDQKLHAKRKFISQTIDKKFMSINNSMVRSRRGVRSRSRRGVRSRSRRGVRSRSRRGVRSRSRRGVRSRSRRGVRSRSRRGVRSKSRRGVKSRVRSIRGVKSRLVKTNNKEKIIQLKISCI